MYKGDMARRGWLVPLVIATVASLVLVGCSSSDTDADSDEAFQSFADEAYAQGPYKGVPLATLHARLESFLKSATGDPKAHCSPPIPPTDPTQWYLGTPMDDGLFTFCIGAEQWWVIQCAAPDDCYYARDPGFYNEPAAMAPLEPRPWMND